MIQEYKSTWIYRWLYIYEFLYIMVNTIFTSYFPIFLKGIPLH